MSLPGIERAVQSRINLLRETIDLLMQAVSSLSTSTIIQQVIHA